MFCDVEEKTDDPLSRYKRQIPDKENKSKKSVYLLARCEKEDDSIDVITLV